MSIAVEDWDDLVSPPRRRRGERAAAGQAEDAPATTRDDVSHPRRRRGESTAAGQAGDAPARTTTTATTPATSTAKRKPVAAEVEDDDSLDDYGENLRPVLSIAGGNLVVWALGHLSGVVELIGVSFFASVGLLLASYILREWHRDRGALVCLVGALPLPITIFSLLT